LRCRAGQDPEEFQKCLGEGVLGEFFKASAHPWYFCIFRNPAIA
jgi:hypothetical protein